MLKINSNSLTLVSFFAVVTNIVPGLLTKAPLRSPIRLRHCFKPLEYVFKSILPAKRGDNSPPLKLVCIGVNNGVAIFSYSLAVTHGASGKSSGGSSKAFDSLALFSANILSLVNESLSVCDCVIGIQRTMASS